MVEKRYHSSLDFATKLKVMEWLKKNEERFAEISYNKIADIGENELQIPLSSHSVRGISQAAGLKHIRGNKENNLKNELSKVMVKSLMDIYSHISCRAPRELLELYENLCHDDE